VRARARACVRLCVCVYAWRVVAVRDQVRPRLTPLRENREFADSRDEVKCRLEVSWVTGRGRGGEGGRAGAKKP